MWHTVGWCSDEVGWGGIKWLNKDVELLDPVTSVKMVRVPTSQMIIALASYTLCASVAF